MGHNKMNNILVIIAVIGIGYLLYRSLVIKRQPNQDKNEQQPGDQVERRNAKESEPSEKAAVAMKTKAETSDEQSDAPSVEAATSQSAEPKPVDDANNDVGAEATVEAQQAVTKAAEKAHMAKAREATQSKLEGHASAGLASDDAPVPLETVKNQIQALSETNEELARHRLYQQIVEQSYKQRDEEQGRLTLMYYAQAHIDEFDKIKGPLKKQNGGKLPQVATFKHYAAALTEDGQYDKAIEVCEKALGYGLKDGTKTGYQGRIERIQKLQAKG